MMAVWTCVLPTLPPDWPKCVRKRAMDGLRPGAARVVAFGDHRLRIRCLQAHPLMPNWPGAARAVAFCDATACGSDACKMPGPGAARTAASHKHEKCSRLRRHRCGSGAPPHLK